MSERFRTIGRDQPEKFLPHCPRKNFLAYFYFASNMKIIGLICKKNLFKGIICITGAIPLDGWFRHKDSEEKEISL